MAAEHQRGYALLVALIALVLASLFGVDILLDAMQTRSGRAQTTGESLALAREALLLFAATYGDDAARTGEVFGYLPCPDTAAKSGLFQPGDGTAAASCGEADAAAIGLLPYKTLGLPDLRDAEGNCLWYAVSGSFKNAPKSTTPVNWDAQGRFSVADAGNRVLAAPDDAHGGAAAVVFAPGAALGSQMRTPGTQPCGADPAQMAAYLESAADSFVHGRRYDANGNPTHNDQIVWIAPRDIFARIVARADFKNPLGTYPEGQLARLAAASRQGLETRVWGDMAALTSAASGAPGNGSAPLNRTEYTQYPGKWIGELPELKPLTAQGRSHDNDFDNWRDQFRYAVCDDLRPVDGCLVFGARRCRGALVFGGRSVVDMFPFGGPRPATQRPQPPARSSTLAHYFESGGGLDLVNGAALAFSGAAAWSGEAPATDVGYCVAPGNFATFAKDIAAVTRVVSSSARPEAAIDTATASLTLGNAAATAAGRGCAWLPTPLGFNTSLRAYFTLRIADLGEGYVLAIADAAANQAALAGGSLCGSAVGSQLGYAGAGLAPPKFGLEIDTRAQTGADCSGSNRNDPGSDHLAFVYWGSPAAADDDNCHGAGSRGDGAQPLNPRTLTKTSAAVQSAIWAQGIVTLSTAAPHGLTNLQQATIAGVVPAGYNGTYPVAVVDATHLAYATTLGDPGAYVGGGSAATLPGIKTVQSSDPHLPYAGALPPATDIHVRLDVAKSFDATLVRTAIWSAATNSTTIATVTPHGLQTGQRINLAGVLPAAYNGSHVITVGDATHFSHGAGADPGSYVSGGRITAPLGVTVQAAAWADNAASITTAVAHGFVSGQPVSVAGIVPAGYNGTHRIVVTGPTGFRYALGADPGAYGAGGTLTPAVALTLRAYVATVLPAFGASYLSTCLSADLRNLAVDLETLCTQNATIAQDNIYMDVDAAGQALATVYAGFANAQSTTAAGRQRATVGNFLIYTQ